MKTRPRLAVCGPRFEPGISLIRRRSVLLSVKAASRTLHNYLNFEKNSLLKKMKRMFYMDFKQALILLIQDTRKVVNTE
jgi:hypothetical protein